MRSFWQLYSCFCLFFIVSPCSLSPGSRLLEIQATPPVTSHKAHLWHLICSVNQEVQGTAFSSEPIWFPSFVKYALMGRDWVPSPPPRGSACNADPFFVGGSSVKPMSSLPIRGMSYPYQRLSSLGTMTISILQPALLSRKHGCNITPLHLRGPHTNIKVS